MFSWSIIIILQIFASAFASADLLARIFASAFASADLHSLIFAGASASADLHAQIFAYASADLEILPSDTSLHLNINLIIIFISFIP